MLLPPLSLDLSFRRAFTLLLTIALLLSVACKHGSSKTPAPNPSHPSEPDAQESADTDTPQFVVPAQLDFLVREAWVKLPDSKGYCAQDYDNFPGGGIYTFYCHINQRGSFADLSSLLGMPIFLSGPHKNGVLNRTAEDSFGHYNPEFVQTIAEWAIPALHDKVFRENTEYIYEYAIQERAQIYWVTYQKLQKHPDFLQAQQEELLYYMDQGLVPSSFLEKFYYFMNPVFIENNDDLQSAYSLLAEYGYDAGWDGNVVKSAVTFWIRRSIDGTAQDFAYGLRQLLQTYDFHFLKNSL